jgi:hypothetical protein
MIMAASGVSVMSVLAVQANAARGNSALGCRRGAQRANSECRAYANGGRVLGSRVRRRHLFTFGDARYYGSAGAMHLNQPIVGMQPNIRR